MTLQRGATTIVEQCLRVDHDEHVVVLNDSNDETLLDALLEAVEDTAASYDYLTYPEPDNHGEEPPSHIAEEMRDADVFIAPTMKSISHTDARREACEAGARGATMPKVTAEIWNTSLQADYDRVKRITNQVLEQLSATESIRITTPSGTDLTLYFDFDHFHGDTGSIHEAGAFGNLPAGEADGGILSANGTFVVDHFPYAPAGTVVHIEDGEVQSIEHPDAKSSEFADALERIDGARNVAEFGFGTNPEATLIGNVLQDEKVLGTVHVAFGDNSTYLPADLPQHTNCDVHWDAVCKSPTVYFDDTCVLDAGDPTFLE